MKTLVICVFTIIFLSFIFVESNTWQADVVKEYIGNDEYIVTKHSLHWDRFINYVIAIPSKIAEQASSLFKQGGLR
ncbi:MAG: hypothetical protein V1727_03185 [Candidatus Omnitrophota bacterium]